MSKAARKDVLLEFLAEHDLALPPLAIHRNLILHERLIVSESTVQNYLDELQEEGLVERVNPHALGEREIEPATEDTGGRAYYLVTDKGRRSAHGEEYLG
jgi:DeoR/GlpR family transcriptional regulator of sugar metabolism